MADKAGKKFSSSADGTDKDELVRKIEKRMTQGQTCNAACKAVCNKLKLSIDT